MAFQLPGTLSVNDPDGPVHAGSSYSDEYLRSFTSLLQVDDAISSLLAQVASLRTRRNEFAAISKLPPETLVEIFALCNTRREEHGYASEMWPYVHYKPTLVCRAWRDIAFSTPSLWTYIRCDSTPTDVYSFSASPKSSPLDVSIDSWVIALRAIFTILSEMHRMRTLRLTPDLEADVDLLGGYLMKPAPLLEDLYIDGEGGIVRSYFELPKYLFDQQAPRLQHLSLKRCIIFGDALAVPGVVERLQHLSLHTCKFVEGMFLRPLRAILEQIHNLKTLEVQLGHIELSAVLERDGTVTDVRQLSRLVLEGSAADLHLILEHFQLSDTICLDLRVFYGQDTDQPSSFAPILANHVLSGTGTSAAQHLVVDGRDGKDRTQRTQLILFVSGGHGSPTVCLTLWSSGSQAFHLDTLLPALCAPFHFGSLRDVTVHSLVNIQPSTLSRIFHRSTAVASLTLGGTGIASAVRMLMHEPSEPMGNGQRDEEFPVLFPALEQLQLEGAPFRTTSNNSDWLGSVPRQRTSKSKTNEFTKVLGDILVKRRKRLPALPPLSVKVVKALLVSADLRRALGRAVGKAAKIVWDNRDPEYSSDSDT